MPTEASRIINGTFTEVWCDGEYIADAYGVQAKVSINKSSINQCGRLATGKKMVSTEGTGSLRIYKTNSKNIQRMAIVKNGKMPVFTLITKVADPDSMGAERIMLTGVTFDDITLADYEAATESKLEMPFTFDDYEPIDTIESEEM